MINPFPNTIIQKPNSIIQKGKILKRDKTHDLIRMRNQLRPRSQALYLHTFNHKDMDNKLPPIWYQNYYSLKQSLQHIVIKNREIQHIVKQYQKNPSVFTIKILQRQIDKNSKAINDADISVMRFKHNHDKTYGGMGFQSETPIARVIKNNIVKYFQSQLAEQIRSLFNNKQQVQFITNRADALQRQHFQRNNSNLNVTGNNDSFISIPNNRSFSNNNPYVLNKYPSQNQNQSIRQNEDLLNRSFATYNQRNSPNRRQQQIQKSIKQGNLSDNRDQVMKQVNYKIQNLNIILRRMNATVHQQGQLVNRIDDNLSQCQRNLLLANVDLKNRYNNEAGMNSFDEGQEQKGFFAQFNYKSKINKITLGLYVLNIVLIIIFLIKGLH